MLSFPIRLGAVVGCLVTAIATPCLAYVDQIQMPLTGHRIYASASGTATFTEGFGQDQDRGAVLTIEVQDVPLPPGTQLDVLVDDRELGVLTLDRQQRGTFKADSRTKKQLIPRLKTGSRVVLKLSGGPVVLW